MRKSLLTILVAVITAMSSVSLVSAETQHPTGLLPSPYDDNVVVSYSSDKGLKKAGNLPSQYDAREESYGGRIRIKDQHPFGLCWAFAASSCMERSYMHQQMLAGKSAAYKELSPLHFGYFFWNRARDPLNGTAGDRNFLNSELGWQNFGGNIYYSAQALANWGGMASAETVPFDPALTTIDKKYAYDDELILDDAVFLTNAEEMKEAIRSNGAIVVSIFIDDPYLSDTGAYYCPDPTGSNHEITVVGWDDNYSRDNFTNGMKPEHNGAWICQNSWGANWGDNGYFYMSYDDRLGTPVALIAEPAEEHDYNYQYDGTAGNGRFTLDSGDRVANFYTAAGSDEEVIDEVGFSIPFDRMDGSKNFTISIYKGVENTTELDAAEPVTSFDVEAQYSGCYSFDVPEEVKLSRGDKYAVVIRVNSDGTAFGVDMSLGNEKTDTSGFKSVIARGQSFYGKGRYWSDCFDVKACARIKVLTSAVEATEPEPDPGKPDGPGEDPDDNPDDENIDIMRLAGNTRYETSTLIASERQKKLSDDKYGVIIVASGANYPDALAGGYLANKEDACLVIVDKAHEQEVENYVREHLSSGGTAFILGGTSAVSSAFETKIKAFACPAGVVTRLGGKTRYETNMEILKAEGIQEDTILICSATGFADSLSASATELPILLVGSSLSKEQENFLKQNDTLDKAVIIGGSGAVSTTVEKQLKTLYPDSVERLAGSSRYETSYLVAKKFYDTEKTDNAVSSVTLAYGKNFPDGLSGGPLAYANRGPLLLVDDNNTKYAQKYVSNASGLSKVYVLGGKALISDAAVSRIINITER